MEFMQLFVPNIISQLVVLDNGVIQWGSTIHLKAILYNSHNILLIKPSIGKSITDFLV